MTVLICTVGGSHEPILEAIKSSAPDFTWFVCTGKDPGTGKPGSSQQIDGPGSVIKAQYSDESPSLPNIPAQAGLSDNVWDIVIVPADDLDTIVETLRKLLTKIVSSRTNERVVVDYTGGTKTMTAAAILAGLEFEQVELQLVTGARSNLQKVHSGTEMAATANVERIRLRQSMTAYLHAWRRFAFAEAWYGLEHLSPPRNPALHSILGRAKSLSAAFAHWDRFDHDLASEQLGAYQPATAAVGFAPYFGALKTLTADGSQREPARLLDLWRNAERRAAQGRYDDAMARCYRLLEWTAQYLLRRDARIDTGNLDKTQLPADMPLQPNQAGKYQVGLFNAWHLVAHHVDGNPGAFYQQQKDKITDLIHGRNSSILAHGDRPVTEEVWVKWKEWVEQSFLPMLLQETTKDRLRQLPPQLPDRFPDQLLELRQGEHA